MGTEKACEFANAYQRKIAPRGRKKEKIAAEAAYSASVVEKAHPNRREGGPYSSDALINAKQECICKLREFLEKGDYSYDKCIDIMTAIRHIYHEKRISNYTFGNAQKWVTIAIKYYIVLSSIDSNNHVDITDSIREKFKCYVLFPVDQTIRKVLRNNYNIDFNYIWYDCDNLKEFETLWKTVGKRISQPLWDWELDEFKPSAKARNLPIQYQCISYLFRPDEKSPMWSK